MSSYSLCHLTSLSTTPALFPQHISSFKRTPHHSHASKLRVLSLRFSRRIFLVPLISKRPHGVAGRVCVLRGVDNLPRGRTVNRQKRSCALAQNEAVMLPRKTHPRLGRRNNPWYSRYRHRVAPHAGATPDVARTDKRAATTVKPTRCR